ncbi:MAG: DNA-binding protein [Elusimicrobiota bacterium]|jgi:predicted DNA-binding protein with PD1-like motif|nr:DNA-binding protein [Elusimicrobiota bacterium]
MQIANGNLGKVVAIRFEPGEDIFKSLIEVCKKESLNNGMILGGIGSLANVVYCNPVKKEEEKSGYGYGAPIITKGAIELTSMSGMICHDEKGGVLTHIHANFSDENGDAYGGHILEGNMVLKTVDVIIAEIKGIDMGRRFDDYLNAFIFNPSQK